MLVVPGNELDETACQLIRAFNKADEIYTEYIDRHNSWESACSGVGSCDYCNKRLYPKRTEYLKKYIGLYKLARHIERKDLCPRLYWYHAETASKCYAGEFHREKCKLVRSVERGDDSPYDVAHCPCALADFMRAAYDADDMTKLRSFADQIYPIFVKIVKPNRDSPPRAEMPPS